MEGEREREREEGEREEGEREEGEGGSKVRVTEKGVKR